MIEIIKTNCNQVNFNLIFNFHNSAKNTKKIDPIGVIHASIENHENSFVGIQEFKLNALGCPGNETTRQYFKDLVSFSKKNCSFRYKKNAVFEGMYGFFGKEYFHLVNPWCATYYPYIKRLYTRVGLSVTLILIY